MKLIPARAGPKTKGRHPIRLRKASSLPGSGLATPLSLGTLTKPRSYCRLASDWACGRVAALHEVEKLLTAAGLDLDSIYAQALSDELGTIERFERLSTIADLRRDAVLREIDRYRAGLARRLHCAVSAELEKANGIRPAKSAIATAARS